jgi:hypothetical protein
MIFIFKCPNTGYKVQSWVSDEGVEERPDDDYETLTCHACGRTHLVNPKSGKVLGSLTR